MIKNSTYWKYYNHAAIPVTPPNKAVNITEIQNGNIWKVDLGGKVLFARWTTDFDCNNVSNFWYVIKDENSKDIKLSEFSKIGLENAYYTYLYDNNTTFKFIEEKDFKGDILNIDPNWVRYKTTPQEDKEWEKIKDKLIKDKRNYRMKIRFGLIKS